MAKSIGKRTARLERPRRVGLILFSAAALALTVMLVAGCGGRGDPRAKVEAGLWDYLGTLFVQDSVFPTGDGPPRITHNGCKDLHRKFLLPPGLTMFKKAEKKKAAVSPRPARSTEKKVALWHWQCYLRFTHFTLTVQVAVNDSNEVVWASPEYGDSRKAPKLSPARTYTG
ncbi:MAG TPA: hypothetical protein VF025_09465 [Gaiellaceae bacterium]